MSESMPWPAIEAYIKRYGEVVEMRRVVQSARNDGADVTPLLEKVIREEVMLRDDLERASRSLAEESTDD